MRISNSLRDCFCHSSVLRRCGLWCVIGWLSLSRSGLAEPPNKTPPIDSPPSNASPVADQTTIVDVAINESSGLAFSHRDPACVWTHNDSGDAARLFCLDSTNGQRVGTCELVDAAAIDWESMTSVPADDSDSSKTKLIVADSGDNQHARDHITLYQFDEPDPRKQTRLKSDEYQSLDVRFPRESLFGRVEESEPIDCEAIWFDAAERSIILIAKSPLPLAGVYSVPMSQWSTPSGSTTVVAKRLATLAVPFATGADCDPTNGDIWLVNYWQAFCFRRAAGDALAQQLARVPEIYSVPKWKQIEAISVDHRSRVWITTEGSPAFLGRITCLKSN